MTEKLILEKLDKLEKQNEKFDVKIDKIEAAVSLIAVQTERINHISSEVTALKFQYDSAFAPDGVINQIKNFQASCPRVFIKENIGNQWTAIGLLAATVTGCLLKAFGVL